MSRTSPARRSRLAVAVALALIAGIATLAPSTATAAPSQDATTSSVSISAFEQIAIGTAHACGIDDQADLYCWGRNDDGQLGTGTQDDELLPVPVAVAGTPLDGKDIEDVATGASSTCALATDDTLACWGDDDEGQLGNGGAAFSLVPTAVSVAGTPLDGADIVDIDLNHKHVCALTSTGTMSCWGLGSVGQIGQGTQANAIVPTGVVTAGSDLDGKTVEAMAAGAFNTCALATDDTVACWGVRSFGVIGSPGTGSYALSPQSPTVTGTPIEGKDLTAITNARYTTCVAATDGTVACWGKGNRGQTGNGGTADQPEPVAVATAGTPLAGKVVDQLDAGSDHVCARTTDGTTACWGEERAIGSGATGDALVPQGTDYSSSALDGDPIVQIAAGWSRSCALDDDGDAACWGTGPIGDGNYGIATLPEDVISTYGPPVTAPTITTATGGPEEIFLAWDPPSNDGGVRPFQVVVSVYDATGTTVLDTADLGTELDGSGEGWVNVAPGTYRVSIAAENGAGIGPASGLTSQITVTARPPDPSLYNPITPCRIVDTRQAGGRFADREIRDFQVTGNGGVFALQGGLPDGCDIPFGVDAVEASITAVDPLDSGFFRAWPTGESMPNATFMNFDRGMDITNTGSITIALGSLSGAEANGGGAGELRVRNFGGSSHYVVDLQGYWSGGRRIGASATATTSAAVAEDAAYAPMTPCRILDTRQAGGALANREIRDIAVIGSGPAFAAQGGLAGGCGIPANTVAIEASVTAVDPADSGFFRAWPNGESMPNATFMNFDRGMDITNTGAITINSNDEEPLRIRNFGGSSHYVIDIQGVYLTDGPTMSEGAEATTSAMGAPSGYVAMTPCRIVDTRIPGQPLVDRQIREITVTGGGSAFAAQGGKAGGCDIPADAIAVEASVTAVGPADSGFFRAWPTGESMPNATFMNFDRGMDITNTGAITINPNEARHLRIRNFGGTSHYVIDIQGYVVPFSMEM